MKSTVFQVFTVHDEAMFSEYRKQVGEIIANSFGGQFLAAGGKATVLDGQWSIPAT